MTSVSRLALLVGAGLVPAALLWVDQGSLERGNRLFRRGDVPEALGIYRAHAGAAVPRPVASYNLGTALLALGSGDAVPHLTLASQDNDSVIAQRSHFNLGYLFLTSVDPSSNPDSAIALLAAAVRSNRAAVLLNLEDEDARWNLALSQRLLDAFGNRLAGRTENKKSPGTKGVPSIQADPRAPLNPRAEARGASGEAEGGAEREAQNLQPGDASGLRASIPGGESEARAGNDPGPLTASAALKLVRGVPDGPEELIRGLLWSHRPKVAWWNGEAFPGGNW